MLLFLVLLPVLSSFAFSWGVKQDIWKRDNATCVTCGKRRVDGHILQCSHYDHDKRKATYNTPNNGRLQCLPCHYDFHYQLYKLAVEQGDEYYAKLHKWSCEKLLAEMKKKKPRRG